MIARGGRALAGVFAAGLLAGGCSSSEPATHASTTKPSPAITPSSTATASVLPTTSGSTAGRTIAATTSTGSATTRRPADPSRAALTAKQVAAAFTRATCPYSWKTDYGTAYNAALAAWTTDGYRATHAYSPAKDSSVAADMRQSHEVQTCTGYQVYNVDTGTYDPNVVTLRVQVTEITSAEGVPPSSYVDYDGYQLTHTSAGWRISADANSGG